MTRLHRKDLKQDEVREKVAEAVKSVSLHGREVFYIIAIVIVVGSIAFAWYFYEQKQQQSSQYLLGQALEKYSSPVAQQPDPNVPKPAYDFKTDSEKYTSALKDFEEVIRKHGNTPAADVARYMVGVCSFYLKDFAKAEEHFKQSGRVSDKNILFFQSRTALADLYSKTGKSDQAVALIREASERSNPLIPKEYLLLQLAEVYEKAGKKTEARETYQKIVDQNKDSAVGFQAQQKLNQVQ